MGEVAVDHFHATKAIIKGVVRKWRKIWGSLIVVRIKNNIGSFNLPTSGNNRNAKKSAPHGKNIFKGKFNGVTRAVKGILSGKEKNSSNMSLQFVEPRK